MQKIIKITREALKANGQKEFKVKKMGSPPDHRDKEALSMLIKAMKQQ